jgi:hypothetical protein
MSRCSTPTDCSGTARDRQQRSNIIFDMAGVRANFDRTDAADICENAIDIRSAPGQEPAIFDAAKRLTDTRLSHHRLRTRLSAEQAQRLGRKCPADAYYCGLRREVAALFANWGAWRTT